MVINSVDDYINKGYDESTLAGTVVAARNPGSWANGLKVSIIDSFADQVISVASTSEFATFSGISTTQGFVKINSEIIYYNSIGTNQLGIGTRGVDGTIPRTHDTGDRSFKYELNGLDLSKINNINQLTNQVHRLDPSEGNEL